MYKKNFLAGFETEPFIYLKLKNKDNVWLVKNNVHFNKYFKIDLHFL